MQSSIVFYFLVLDSITPCWIPLSGVHAGCVLAFMFMFSLSFSDTMLIMACILHFGILPRSEWDFSFYLKSNTCLFIDYLYILFFNSWLCLFIPTRETIAGIFVFYLLLFFFFFNLYNFFFSNENKNK